MRRTILHGLIVLCPLAGHSQETTGSIPLGLATGIHLEGAARSPIEVFDPGGAMADDAIRAANGKLPLYARFLDASGGLADGGSWTELGQGDRIWRLRVISAGAQAIECFFADVHLPAGSQLHVYDASGSEVHGGYTAQHVQEDGSLSADMVMGDDCVIEYFEPATVRGEGSLRLTRVLHAYNLTDMQKTGACEVDVNCTEGAEWADQRDAVVRIRVIVPSGAGYCTGTLMNNTANDCKGYILTAFHCTEESVSANFSGYQFRFNYQRPSCSGGTATSDNLTGCVFRAGSQDQGGTYGSDYSLVELTSPIPASYNPYWAGWDINISAPLSGVCIHHPDGDVKKVSTFASAPSSATWAGFTNGSHWRVVWSATDNGHGVTEPGSSGSPLFNPSKRVVGTLTGGSSCCTVNGCNIQGSGPTAPDFFGKMNYHWWENNPNPTAEELHWWLAPVSGPAFQNGSRNPCGPIGVEEIVDASPMLYPNPTDGIFTLKLPRGMSFGNRIKVHDPTGRLLHEVSVQSDVALVDATGWAPGAYLVTIVREGRTVGSATLIR